MNPSCVVHPVRFGYAVLLASVTMLVLANPATAETGDEPEPMRWQGWQGGWYVSDPGNWAGRTAPEAMESQPVDFRSQALVVVDRDQHFRGGLHMDDHRLNMAWYLRGHTLTLAGDVRIGAGNSSGFFSEGTLRLGESEHPANVHLYARPGEGGLRLTETAALHTDHVAALTVSDASGNTNAQGMLDVSQASLVDDALRVEVLRLGRYRGRTPGRGGDGTLRLPASVRAVEVDELWLGVNERRVGDGDTSFARGVLDFGDGESVTVRVRSAALWAVGDHAMAELVNMPSRLDLTLGAPDASATWRIADNDLLEDSEGETAFELIAPAGALRAHLDKLIVGRNRGQAGSASAVLDLSAMTLDAFTAEQVIIGDGPAATARVELPPGHVTFGTLRLGDGGRLVVSANEAGGLDVIGDDDDALGIAGEGKLRIRLADADSGRWLVRLRGQREDELSAMIDDERVTVEGVDIDRLLVRYADGRTMLVTE